MLRNVNEKKLFNLSQLSGFLLVLPFIYTLFYLLRNNQLPGNDAANYFSSAVNIYHYFLQGGIVKGILHSYLERGWRPIFFPDLAVPFLLISRGNLFFTYAAVACVCLLASLTYVYQFLRLQLDNISAIIASSLICLLPFVQAQIVMFYSESALFPCVIASLYHLIKSNYLRNLPHIFAFVVFASLSVWIRPIEAVTHFFFIFLLFTFSGWYHSIFSLRQIMTVLFLALLSACMFFTLSYWPYLHTPIIPVMDNGGILDKKMALILHSCFKASSIATIALGGMVAYLHIFTTKEKLFFKQIPAYPAYFTTTFATLFFLILCWFLPFAFVTFQWIYRTSLGDVALSTGSLSGSQFSWDVLRIYLHEEGLLAISVIIMITFFGVLAIPYGKKIKTIFSTPIIYLMCMLPFPIWEAFYTVQIVTRKLSIVFPALLMAMLMIGLQRNKGWWLRISMLVSLVLVQFGFLMALAMTKTYENPQTIFANSVGYFIPAPVVIKPNPHDVAIQFFNEYAQKTGMKALGMEVLPGTPDARHPIEAEPINPFLTSMMVQAGNYAYYANYLYFSTYDRANIKKIGEQYDTVFLADKITEMNIDAESAKKYEKKYLQETNPSIKVFYEFLFYYASHRLQEVHWELGPCMVFDTQKSGQYRGCLLAFKK